MNFRNPLIVNYVIIGLLCLSLQATDELPLTKVPNEIWQEKILVAVAKAFSSKTQISWHEARRQLKQFGFVCKTFYFMKLADQDILKCLVPAVHHHAATKNLDKIFECKFEVSR
jgi:hypothetical protein